MDFSTNRQLELAFEGMVENESLIKGNYKATVIPNNNMEVGGKMELNIVNADLLKDMSILGKMDPYCVVSYKDIKNKTAAVSGS
jgi:hypothetical protein